VWPVLAKAQMKFSDHHSAPIGHRHLGEDIEKSRKEQCRQTKNAEIRRVDLESQGKRGFPSHQSRGNSYGKKRLQGIESTL